MGSTPNYLDRFLGISEDGRPLLTEHGERGPGKRTPYERDIDRLKYTEYFRRLKDVTQVARAGESYLYHDRLSHSLKVAQVGRRFAEYIQRVDSTAGSFAEVLDPDLIEAACLAHDLGHPPFGHLAEKTLDRLLQEKTNPHLDTNDLEPTPSEPPTEAITEANHYDEHAVVNGRSPPGRRFEGNAQTFRILTRLAPYRDAETGLALTVGVLNAVQKYPYGRGEWLPDDTDEWSDELDSASGRTRGKFGYYESEADIFEEIYDASSTAGTRTVAAEIMDYADDITYAIHDLTDFYKDGRLPMDRLLREAFDTDDIEGTHDSAERRELKKLDSELDYDPDVVTPTDVINSLATTMYSTTEELLLLEPYEGTPEQRDEIEEFTSFLVEEYLNRVYHEGKRREELENNEEIDRYLVLDDSGDSAELVVSETLRQHIDILQQITRYYVIQQPTLMGQQRGQQQVVRELFEALFEESGKSELRKSAIPMPYKNWLDVEKDEIRMETYGSEEERRARVVADLIASMTEPQVVELHKRLTGDAPGSLQNDIVR